MKWALLAGAFLLSCGGASRDGDATGGGSGGATGGTRSGTGGAAESSGAAASTGGAAPFDPSRPACQPNQWVCPSTLECAYERGGVVVAADCYCDPSLPADVTCRPNSKLACLQGAEDSTGEEIRTVHFGCRCVPAETTCNDCADLFGVTESNCQSSSDFEGVIVCGCSRVDPV